MRAKENISKFIVSAISVITLVITLGIRDFVFGFEVPQKRKEFEVVIEENKDNIKNLQEIYLDYISVYFTDREFKKSINLIDRFEAEFSASKHIDDFMWFKVYMLKYFYQRYQPLFDTKTSYQFNFYFTPSNQNNNLVSIVAGFLVGKDCPNSYLISTENYSDPYWQMLYDAFEKGGGSEEDKFNTSGIYSQVQDVFGELNLNVDGDNHISIVRLPIIGPTGYFSKINSHSPGENISK